MQKEIILKLETVHLSYDQKSTKRQQGTKKLLLSLTYFLLILNFKVMISIAFYYIYIWNTQGYKSIFNFVTQAP